VALSEPEVELLRASQRDKSQLVRVVVNGCAYSCCGKGWRRRDGYEQDYIGYIDNLKEPETVELAGQDVTHAGTFMLYAAGIGTISYVIACRFFEVELVELAV
jgi:hypothetical protein